MNLYESNIAKLNTKKAELEEKKKGTDKKITQIKEEIFDLNFKNYEITFQEKSLELSTIKGNFIRYYLLVIAMLICFYSAFMPLTALASAIILITSALLVVGITKVENKLVFYLSNSKNLAELNAKKESLNQKKISNLQNQLELNSQKQVLEKRSINLESMIKTLEEAITKLNDAEQKAYQTLIKEHSLLEEEVNRSLEIDESVLKLIRELDKEANNGKII